MNILGISAFYHDAAACLVQDGAIIAAAQEERFTRVKHDESFPRNAIDYCLRKGGVQKGDLDFAVFYDKPLTKFFRILRTHLAVAPWSQETYLQALSSWFKTKLWVPYYIEKCCRDLGYGSPRRIGFTDHHQSHAASAFYPSPFQEAAILTLDGVGEWATGTLGQGSGRRLSILREIRFPHSLGLLYSAFTYFCGFKVNSGEYKLMGLAPYGEPKYVDEILAHLIEVRADGSFHMNLEYFDYLGGLTMTNGKFAELFGGPARKPEGQITQREMDLARSIQVVTEEIVLKLADFARRTTGAENLCLAGGVALNCVANGRVLRESAFKKLWIQPAAGDAGGAVGAALFAWHEVLGNDRTPCGDRDAMSGAFLGPSFGDDEIGAFLDAQGYPYERLAGPAWAPKIGKLIADGNVIGLLQGRMELGPRALGGRSIIGDARSPKMQSVMNLKIKYRESFRPFAPSVLRERVSDYFDLDEDSPYMLLVAPVKAEHLLQDAVNDRVSDLREWVSRPRSTIPAVTHVDGSARIQTVDERDAPRYHALIKAFEDVSGCGVVINTSFNVRGEPIVCTPEDAYRCFMRTEMDYLVLESFLLSKQAQPAFSDAANWREEFALD